MNWATFEADAPGLPLAAAPNQGRHGLTSMALGAQFPELCDGEPGGGELGGGAAECDPVSR
jgi:hypothetical protein